MVDFDTFWPICSSRMHAVFETTEQTFSAQVCKIISNYFAVAIHYVVNGLWIVGYLHGFGKHDILSTVSMNLDLRACCLIRPTVSYTISLLNEMQSSGMLLKIFPDRCVTCRSKVEGRECDIMLHAAERRSRVAARPPQCCCDAETDTVLKYDVTVDEAMSVHLKSIGAIKTKINQNGK